MNPQSLGEVLFDRSDRERAFVLSNGVQDMMEGREGSGGRRSRKSHSSNLTMRDLVTSKFEGMNECIYLKDTGFILGGAKGFTVAE